MIKSTNFLYTASLFTFLCSLLFNPLISYAQGDLMIFPKRIVFDNSRRAQELSLSNSGKDSARYVISVIQIRMTENGSFETIISPDSSQNFADKNFRFFPRTVTLAPNESQTVKIQIIKTNELAIGEYRSHLHLRAQEQKPTPGEAVTEKDASSISISIKPVIAISIPVIIKIGESNTQVSLSNLAVNLKKDIAPSLDFKFTRTGNMSAYGDVSVTHISASGKVTKVGSAQGVAIYTPTPARSFHMSLDKSKTNLYNSGNIKVTYSTQSPIPVTLAEASITLK